MTLTREHRGHASSPNCFHRREDPQLVVNHQIVVGGIALLHVVQLALLVDVNEDLPIHRLLQARALDLARLKHRIPVGEDHRWTPAGKAFQHVQRARKEAIGEGIVDQKRRDRQHV